MSVDYFRRTFGGLGRLWNSYQFHRLLSQPPYHSSVDGALEHSAAVWLPRQEGILRKQFGLAALEADLTLFGGQDRESRLAFPEQGIFLGFLLLLRLHEGPLLLQNCLLAHLFLPGRLEGRRRGGMLLQEAYKESRRVRNLAWLP